jgi:hypothetical protein
VDERVAQEAGRDRVGLGAHELAVEEVLPRRVDARRLGKRLAEDQARRLGGGPAHVVGDAGPEADLDEPAEAARERRVHRPVVDHRIAERRGEALELRGREIGVDGVHVHRAHPVHLVAQVARDLARHARAEGVALAPFEGNLDSVRHRLLLTNANGGHITTAGRVKPGGGDRSCWARRRAGRRC